MIALKDKNKKHLQSTMSFSQWVLKTIKKHKKRANIDVILGLSITTIILLVYLV
ncbi:putative membrane protein [Evansella vedderi]|uniref:Membrane protein n=1 Tax=Evansella vedderi TaxID=38282 RepID=A0ABT9ZRR6_9BACI|nr:hypothetical protein [Evansella vedderi]MDQ0253918.1 putative membrane protein [Evansella vedderi]